MTPQDAGIIERLLKHFLAVGSVRDIDVIDRLSKLEQLSFNEATALINLTERLGLISGIKSIYKITIDGEKAAKIGVKEFLDEQERNENLTIKATKTTIWTNPIVIVLSILLVILGIITLILAINCNR
jgi:hypothetical protein